MKKRVKTKWLKALRSGKYQQGKERLFIPATQFVHGDNDTDKYCCLGVLCHLYAQEKKVSFKKVINAPGSFAGSVLPYCVQKWAGLEQDNPTISGKPKKDILGYPHIPSLAGMNDGGRSFKQIANTIEKKL